MDHHALMWDEATRDLTAEATETALTNALVDLAGVRDFTHIATSRDEYLNRAALTADTVQTTAARWNIDPDAVQQQLDISFNHVLAIRQAAAVRTARKTGKTAAAASQALTITAAIASPDAPQAATEAPGAPADPLAADTTAKTSKPRTLPSGGAAAAVPMPAPVTPGVAPAPAAMSPAAGAAPGAQAAPPHTASRQASIEADIAALNPHLPQATITRLAANAMRHLAVEPLAYGNWDNAPDGPITNSVKNWSPGHGGKSDSNGAGLSGDNGGDDSPAGPAAAGSAADSAAPAAASELADVLPLAAAAAAR